MMLFRSASMSSDSKRVSPTIAALSSKSFSEGMPAQPS
jgi:hypothetical protein